MTLTLESIQTGTTQRPPRIVLVGTEKVGKSTFASQAPSAVIIPIKGEEGIDDLDVAKFPRAESYSDVLEAMRSLYKGEHEYRVVVIDSASALEPLIWQHVCAEKYWKSIEAPGFGKGYVEAARYWRELTNAIDLLREERKMACIVIGHVKAKLINDPLTDPYDAFVFDVHDRASSILYRWSDSILFATRRVITRKAEISHGREVTRAVGEDESVLYTRSRPSHPGGGRGAYGHLDYELPLNWNAFAQSLSNARQNGKEQNDG